MTPTPGNLIRWGSKHNPSTAYAVLCGFTDDGESLDIVLSPGRNRCTAVVSYPRGAVLVPQDNDAIIA